MRPPEAPQGPSDPIPGLDLALYAGGLEATWGRQDEAALAKLDSFERRAFMEAVGYFVALLIEAARRGEVGSLAGAVRTASIGSPPSGALS